VRRERAWSGSGGGVSAYVALPAWQAGLVPAGGTAVARRAVSDVAFNADPLTGQYVAVTRPGASSPDWNAYGGTSIAAPQWAGIVAVANAMRANAGRERLGDLHATLYRSIAPVPGDYAAAFADVTTGADGDCAGCRAGIGYDLPTGLGTPNGAGLLALLTGVRTTPVSTAPGVPGGVFSAHAGVAFSHSLGVTVPAGESVTYLLSGAPAGMAVGNGGVLRWAAPLLGTWSFTVTASAGGQSAAARYTLVVGPNHAPRLAGGSFQATTAAPFGARLAATDQDADTLAYAMTGNPAGLELSSSGLLTWTHPVAGRYTLQVTARDPGGLAATATFALSVARVEVAPKVASTSFSGHPGAALAVQMVASDGNGDALRWSLEGAPSGMTISPAGRVSWAAPVAGHWNVAVRATDPSGRVGSGALAVRIAAESAATHPTPPRPSPRTRDSGMREQ